MKQHVFLAAAAAFGALSAGLPALAQDNQTPWTGFYLGINAGGTWGHTSNQITAEGGGGSITIPPGDITTVNGLSTDSSNDLRFIGGAEGGYNYQWSNLLIGLETDFDDFQLKQNRSTTFNSAVTVNPPPPTAATFTIGQKVTTDWLWTVRPRIGYASGDWLIYGTGGMAMAPIKLVASYVDNRTPPNSATLSVDNTKTGWVVGGGAAWLFSEHLSVKAEYLLANLGAVRGTATTTDGFATITSQARIKANIVRMGVDFRF